MTYDILIIGGGVAGIACGLIVGSAMSKPFMEGKKSGLIAHQKASHLQSALLNNAYGVPAGSTGAELLDSSLSQLQQQYPEVEILTDEKVMTIRQVEHQWEVVTNKNTYKAEHVVVATGYAQPFTIAGLEEYLQPHQKANPIKNRIELRNNNHLVAPGLYVAGSLAGHISQVTIAAGSGAMVATDILSKINNGNPTQIHDKVISA